MRSKLKSIVLTVSALAAATPTFAADTVFTMGNYPVEATAANAVAAKDKAIADGQQAAFRSLLKRIVPVTAYKQISRIPSKKAAELISGVSVRSERNSPTEYIASLDFAFQAQAVRNALSAEGIPFVDEPAEKIIVVPVLRQGNPSTVTNDTGGWRKSWAGLDLAHTITPVQLGELKPVVHSDTIAMLADGDSNGMRIVSQEYATDRIVFAILEPDISNKSVVVTLAGQDSVGPLALKRTYRVSDGDMAYATELAAVVALGVIEGRWKATKSAPAPAYNAAAPDVSGAPVWAAAPATGGDVVQLTVQYADTGQWNELRAQLLDTPGVDNLAIAAQAERYAEVSLSFPGGAKSLARALGGRGLALVDDGQGLVLRRSY